MGPYIFFFSLKFLTDIFINYNTIIGNQIYICFCLLILFKIMKNSCSMKKITDRTANVPKKPTIEKVKTLYKSPSNKKKNERNTETESEIFINVKKIDLSNFFISCWLS